MISFQRPESLIWTCLLTAGALLLGFYSFRRKHDLWKGMGNVPLIKKFSNLKNDRTRLNILFHTLSVFFLMLAASGPQARTPDALKRDFVDIVVLLDVSRSMAAEDFGTETRLQKAKEVLKGFIPRVNGNRVGIVTYAGSTLEQAPLTNDYAALRFIIDEWIQINSVQLAGSDMVRALKSGIEAFSSSNRKKILLLLSDGGGDLKENELNDVCRTLMDRRIGFIAVGFGSREGIQVDVNIEPSGPYGGGTKRTVVSRLEEERLKSLVAKAGGTYVNGNRDGLDLASELFRKEIVGNDALEGYQDISHLPVLASICFFALTLLF